MWNHGTMSFEMRSLLINLVSSMLITTVCSSELRRILWTHLLLMRGRYEFRANSCTWNTIAPFDPFWNFCLTNSFNLGFLDLGTKRVFVRVYWVASSLLYKLLDSTEELTKVNFPLLRSWFELTGLSLLTILSCDWHFDGR